MSRSNGSENVSGAGSTGSELLLELAQRLLTYHYPGDPTAEIAKLLPGEVAKEFPTGVPMPEDRRIIGSLVMPKHITVVFDTSMSPEQLVAFYKERMTAAGWTEPEPWPFFREGGFQHNIMEQVMGSIFCRDAASMSLHVEASPADSTATEGRLKYDTDPRVSHCAQQRRQRKHFADMLAEIIPSLSAPAEGIQMPKGWGGRSDTHSDTSAYLKSSLDLTAVADHYRTQLTNAGWQEQESGENESVAWSTYKFRDEDKEDWNGLFFVVSLPKKEGWYALFAEAALDGLEEQFGGMVFLS